MKNQKFWVSVVLRPFGSSDPRVRAWLRLAVAAPQDAVLVGPKSYERMHIPRAHAMMCGVWQPRLSSAHCLHCNTDCFIFCVEHNFCSFVFRWLFFAQKRWHGKYVCQKMFSKKIRRCEITINISIVHRWFANIQAWKEMRRYRFAVRGDVRVSSEWGARSAINTTKAAPAMHQRAQDGGRSGGMAAEGRDRPTINECGIDHRTGGMMGAIPAILKILLSGPSFSGLHTAQPRRCFMIWVLRKSKLWLIRKLNFLSSGLYVCVCFLCFFMFICFFRWRLINHYYVFEQIKNKVTHFSQINMYQTYKIKASIMLTFVL